MISELAGYTVSREIPDKCLSGLASGAFKLCGGVIRDNSGKIVAHLLSGFNPLDVFNPAKLAIGGLNTVQLGKLAKDMSTLLSLAKGTMALSGLTLAVSAAGFIFLNNKLNKIDAQLKSLAGNVKFISNFLDLTERAQLINALDTLSGIEHSDEEVRRIELVNTMKTLGVIHVKYRMMLSNVSQLEEVLPIEEYYSITALGYTMCAAELNKSSAVSFLDGAYKQWLTDTRRITNNLILRGNPERFLFSGYAADIKTEEIIDWMNFAHSEDKGVEHIDELRKNLSAWKFDQLVKELLTIFPNVQLPPIPLPFLRPNKQVEPNREIEVIRQLCARNPVFAGYISQYQFMQEIGKRPSELQKYFDTLNIGVDECCLLVNDALLDK